MHHKLMQAMVEREAGSVLWGTVQADDAYLGGELNDGTPGRGSENMVPFLAAVSLDDDGHPQGDRRLGRRNLSPASTVISDGLPCFAGVTDAGCTHQPTVVGGRKPKELPLFHWVNTVLGYVKTGLSGA
jgi:hypothetical protein